MNEDEVIQRLKARYPDIPLRIYLAHLNLMAGSHGLHIASQEDLLLKIDDVVVARMYYDATEKCYVVTEQEAGEADEEKKWDALFAQPHVQSGLTRRAREAKRQFAAGETEEGGFGGE